MVNYQEKYLKYKNKYENLKNSLNQNGGNYIPAPPTPAPTMLSCNPSSGTCYNDSNGKFYPSVQSCNSLCAQEKTQNRLSNRMISPVYNPVYSTTYSPITPVYFDDSYRPIKKVVYYDEDESEYSTDSEYDYVVSKRRKSSRRKSSRRKSSRRKSSRRKSSRRKSSKIKSSRRKSSRRKSSRRKSTRKKSYRGLDTESVNIDDLIH
jgi:hypothetical protein